MKPRLCRVAAYSRPGFPRPTMIFTSKTPLRPSPRRPGAILPPRFCLGVSLLLLWAEVSPREDTPPMFGIGYQEMFIVLVVAMVIFGPKRLPELAGQVGRWVRDFRRMSSDLTGEFEKTFAEVDEVKKSFTRELQGIQEEVEGVGKSARGDLKKSGAKAIADGKKATGAGKKGTAAAATGSNPARSPSLSKTVPTSKEARRQWRAGEDRARRQVRWNCHRKRTGGDKSGPSRRCLVLRPRRRRFSRQERLVGGKRGGRGRCHHPRAAPPSRIRLCPAELRMTSAWSFSLTFEPRAQ